MDQLNWSFLSFLVFKSRICSIKIIKFCQLICQFQFSTEQSLCPFMVISTSSRSSAESQQEMYIILITVNLQTNVYCSFSACFSLYFASVNNWPSLLYECSFICLCACINKRERYPHHNHEDPRRMWLQGSPRH